MKLNICKTYSITISRFRIPHPSHPLLTLRGLDLEVSNSLKLVRVTIDDELSFKSIFAILLLLLPKKTGLICNVTRLLAITMQYSNPSMHFFTLL